jgi:hypothetical protein
MSQGIDSYRFYGVDGGTVGTKPAGRGDQLQCRVELAERKLKLRPTELNGRGGEASLIGLQIWRQRQRLFSDPTKSLGGT